MSKKIAKKAPVKAPKKVAAPRKTKAATATKPSPMELFSQKELKDLKAKLSEMRASLAKNMDDKKNLDMMEPEVGDPIDQASQSLDKEILFELSDNERHMLDDVEAALRKLDRGIYGICEQCQKPILPKRLKAIPSVRYCMVCQSGAERHY